jgi:hypothetical protein
VRTFYEVYSSPLSPVLPLCPLPKSRRTVVLLCELLFPTARLLSPVAFISFIVVVVIAPDSDAFDADDGGGENKGL